MKFDTMLLIEGNREARDLSDYYQRVLSSDVPDICYNVDVMSEALGISHDEATTIMEHLDAKGYSHQLNEVMKTRVNRDGKIAYTSAYKKIRDSQSKAVGNANLSRMMEKRLRFFERQKQKTDKDRTDRW